MTRDTAAVATITWARSVAEESLLRRSLEKLAGAGLRVAVADAGTNAGFTDFLVRLPGFEVTVPAERGLIPQVASALNLCMRFDARFVLYTEPDKEAFLGGGLPA